MPNSMKNSLSWIVYSVMAKSIEHPSFAVMEFLRYQIVLLNEEIVFKLYICSLTYFRPYPSQHHRSPAYFCKVQDPQVSRLSLCFPAAYNLPVDQLMLAMSNQVTIDNAD
uniref:Uncharacterized protein n=1 Tax=Meloidogyne incognita TaxID=6306 RepID=A0A914MSM8_MELIC